MHVPSITGLYLAILALLYVVLAMQVVRLRRKTRAAFNDGGCLQLRARSGPTRTLPNTSPSSP
jgi:uncharacterized protein